MKGNGNAHVFTHVETRFKGVVETGIGQFFIGNKSVLADGVDDKLLLSRIFPFIYNLVIAFEDFLLP